MNFIVHLVREFNYNKKLIKSTFKTNNDRQKDSEIILIIGIPSYIFKIYRLIIQ